MKEARRILDRLADKKAVDPVALDVSALAGYADVLVVAGGTSAPHVRTLVEHLLEDPGRPTYLNVSPDDSWWILDYVDVVVHVFRQEVREHYGLERLWGDAPVFRAEKGKGESGGLNGGGTEARRKTGERKRMMD